MGNFCISVSIWKPFHPSLLAPKIFFNLQIFLQFYLYFGQFYPVVGRWLYFQLYILHPYHIFYGGIFLKNISIGKYTQATCSLITLFILAWICKKGFPKKSTLQSSTTIFLNCLCLLQVFKNLKGFMNVIFKDAWPETCLIRWCTSDIGHKSINSWFTRIVSNLLKIQSSFILSFHQMYLLHDLRASVSLHALRHDSNSKGLFWENERPPSFLPH